MYCYDEQVDLKNLSKDEIIMVLKKERNNFAKSRQEWIFACFLLTQGDNEKFNELVKKELCLKCLDYYSSIKIEV